MASALLREMRQILPLVGVLAGTIQTQIEVQGALGGIPEGSQSLDQGCWEETDQVGDNW